VEENLLFVLKATGWKNKKEMKAQIRDVLQKVGLSTKGFKLPHQLSAASSKELPLPVRCSIIPKSSWRMNLPVILIQKPPGEL